MDRRGSDEEISDFVPAEVSVEDIAKALIGLGVLFVIVGGGLFLIGKVPGLGRLPGDIVIQRDNFTCVFPLATSIVLSLLLTLAINFILRINHK
ncbi:MAG: DUF2905 domain-containing protein [Chloroflexi bacterium]|nr:DUF2905 domain-containing protein [Chloroflexota bacterium]